MKIEKIVDEHEEVNWNEQLNVAFYLPQKQ